MWKRNPKRVVSMRVLGLTSVLVIAALAIASPARGEDARETARRMMHEALAEKATLPVRPPLMPERAAAEAVRAREQAVTTRAGAAHVPQGATKQAPQDARNWRTDAANRAAAGAAAGHGGDMMHSGTGNPGSSDCSDAAGMMRTTGHDPHGGTMPGGGMMPGGMDGMPGHH